MQPSFWSLVPFLLVIPMAMLTRQVLPGLVVGLIAGAYMMIPDPLGGLEAAIDYLLRELASPDNLRLLVFLYGFGSFVGLVRVTGGVSGFARWMNRTVRSARGAFGLTWLSSAGTFMAPDFRIITIGPVMKKVFQRFNVPTWKVAFVIDATSTPLIALIPIGTAFVGYMVGLINDSAGHQGLPMPAYKLLLASLPFNFFSILMLIYALYRSFFTGKVEADDADKNDCPPGIRTPFRTSPQVAYLEEACKPDRQKRKAKEKSSGDGSEHEADSDFPDPVEKVSESATPRAIHLILPILVLVGLTFLFTWLDGIQHASSPLGALAEADASKAMLWAVLVTLVLSIIWYRLRGQPLQRLLFGFLQGGNEMMGVNVLLALVWALTAVSEDLGFIQYTKQLIGDSIPPLWVAPIIFLLGCLISYVIGSSFGAWAILMPLGFSIASGTETPLPLVAGAVFASGSFGGFASPLSDNTVAMATMMKLPLMKYAHRKLKASVFVVIASAVLYAVAGWLLGS
ncbi:Na+/H+ antiporter family protein [Melghirimyces thermohalophilus]|uniref:Na+/H+ antiporter family protein n=1 Tax=Melghirimyces thermohalophilus TaxID=1236220 RepID=A0A1G6L520_9BACL|nr:Na+/H+ antiporter NhaC family protein [Melghirimyces thermohalophilus]SDC38267.1 Na+/H+ antiporter family protein [Melghirimyces thermohalophilus]